MVSLGFDFGFRVILSFELWLRLWLVLGKQLLQSLPKTLTLTHNTNPQIKQLKTAHAQSIDRTKNYAAAAATLIWPRQSIGGSCQSSEMVTLLLNTLSFV